MRKEDSLALKGVAIVMMLLYHLFYVKSGGEYSYLLCFAGGPLIKRFSEICYPVTLYIILSGYGLFASYTSSGNIKWWKRAKNLYLHLWIIYLIFLPIACYLIPNEYPGGLLIFIKNAFSISSSYNAEQWFLMPYLILLAISCPLFWLIEKWRPSLVVILAIVCEIVYLYLYKSYGLGYLRNRLLVFNHLYLAMGFILPFSLGALANKYKLVERVMKFTPLSGGNGVRVKQLCCFSILLIIVIFRMYYPQQTLQIIVVFIIMLLFPSLQIGTLSMKILQFLGKHSMNIWLIHTWICYYLFKDFIYGFQWPILIFGVTLSLSLLVSILVEFVYNGLIKITK